MTEQRKAVGAIVGIRHLDTYTHRTRVFRGVRRVIRLTVEQYHSIGVGLRIIVRRRVCGSYEELPLPLLGISINDEWFRVGPKGGIRTIYL